MVLMEGEPQKMSVNYVSVGGSKEANRSQKIKTNEGVGVKNSICRLLKNEM